MISTGFHHHALLRWHATTCPRLIHERLTRIIPFLFTVYTHTHYTHMMHMPPAASLCLVLCLTKHAGGAGVSVLGQNLSTEMDWNSFHGKRNMEESMCWTESDAIGYWMSTRRKHIRGASSVPLKPCEELASGDCWPGMGLQHRFHFSAACHSMPRHATACHSMHHDSANLKQS